MRFLVADDEVVMTESLQVALEFLGHSVDVVWDGASALEAALEGCYDILVLDRHMPIMTGDEVVAALRASGARVPVLMVTAMAEVSDLVDGFDLGADDYLPKPFALAEFQARVAGLLRRSSGVYSNTVLTAGEIRIDLERRLVTRGGERLALSPKLYAILVELVRANGALVSSQKLLSAAWGEDAAPSGNAVQRTISELRTALGAPSVVETVSRGGYRICT